MTEYWVIRLGVYFALGTKPRNAGDAWGCGRSIALGLHKFDHLTVIVFVNPRGHMARHRDHDLPNVAVPLVDCGNVIPR